jgi:acetyl-CoA/propionyl-CoA carboxylase, biotin carboxylase, biotin carboxyl carrier protein
MFERVLVANRGEIAVRVIRACRDLGIVSIAVFSEADASALHVRLADEAYPLPGRTGAESYLNIGALMDAVARSGADAVHPGYGFLSESTELAQALAGQGAAFVGPGLQALVTMGSKLSARRAAAAAGVRPVPGRTNPVEDAAEVLDFAAEWGYPIAIKASHGGGGRGIRVVARAEDVPAALESARREAAAYFGRAEVYLERYLSRPKHVEMQIFGDTHGNVVWLGERECSVQRRHQKLIEESPAYLLSPQVRDRMGDAAAAVARQVGYFNAGTVEFLLADDEFYFLEMNTRLQVEHPVTEMVTGIDLVAEQLRVAAGNPLSFTQAEMSPRGHAIEVRVNAEDPAGGRFLPAPGRITGLHEPGGFGVRVDAGYAPGDTVSGYYDGLIAKVICWGSDRPAALARTRRALRELAVTGVPTTVPAQQLILDHPDFVAGRHHTRWLEETVSFADLPAATVRTDGAVDGDGEVQDDAADEDPALDGRSYVSVAGRRYWIPFLGSRPDVAAGRGVTRPATPEPPETHLHPPAADLGPHLGDGRVIDGRVIAPMQGTILKVVAAAGQHVGASDVICVLEAMKMETPVSAGLAGRVGRLDVQVGQTVRAGQLLALVERSPECKVGNANDP